MLPLLLLLLVLRLVLVLVLLLLLLLVQLLQPRLLPLQCADLRLVRHGCRRRHEGTARCALGMPHGEQCPAHVLRDELQYSGDSQLCSPMSRGPHA